MACLHNYQQLVRFESTAGKRIRSPQSFAPRVRLDHANLTRANLLPLIQVDGVQKVRVTGILKIDSEHSLDDR